MPDGFQCVNPLEIPGWNKTLLTYPEYNFFHTREWMQVLADTYGYTPFFF